MKRVKHHMILGHAVLGFMIHSAFADNPSGPIRASVLIGNDVLGETSHYIGATEAGVFFIDDLIDLGINVYRMWTKMAELEWWDDDDARAASPYSCTEIGIPSIAEIKADEINGFDNVIPWDWWDEQFTGTYYQWSGNSREEVIQKCIQNGITPVVVLRTMDDQGNPDACGDDWAPDSPITDADLNEWWEHCFAVAYWLNFLHDYEVTHFEILNEPDLPSQGWHGNQAEYVQLLETAEDAVRYANGLAGIGTILHAPVVSNSNSPYIAYTLDNADSAVDVVDYHNYDSDPSSSIATVQNTVMNNDTDGVMEPIWLSEWGTYSSTYDDVDRAILTARQLLLFSEQMLEGVTIFGMYDWGPFDGLLNQDRTRSETYYAYRLMIRGLIEAKDRLQVASSGVGDDVLATWDDGILYMMVINGDANIDTDVSAVGIDSGTVSIYEYSNAHKDEIVATPTVSAGQFSFDAPATAVVLAVVTPVAPLVPDFGDAPDPPYPTTIAQNGPRHTITPGFYLGNSLDPEPDGQQHPTANGDDVLDGNDDEDGVLFIGSLVPGSVTEVQVTASAAGFLDAWVDFDGNGSWGDADEQIFDGTTLEPGTNTLYFDVPMGAIVGNTYSRFRFSNAGGLSWEGLAQGGEVEDHMIDIEIPVELSSFTARWRNDTVILEWITLSESENLGFLLYRADVGSGEFERITNELIPGAGNCCAERHYRHIDRDIETDGSYQYMLSDVSVAGIETSHGPITITVSFREPALSIGFPFPTPMVATTMVRYELPENTTIRLTLYDLAGHSVAVISEGKRGSGEHVVTLSREDLSKNRLLSGLYVLRLHSPLGVVSTSLVVVD